jgi:isovaleryl-CoA dehydrogenase
MTADKGNTSNKDYAAVYLYAAENATQAALSGMQILGGVGYTNDVAVGRILRDAKLYEIGGGTTEIRRQIIGKDLVLSYGD